MSPIGRHRSACLTPSKGKRSKKRKRQEARARGDSIHNPGLEPPPPVPRISDHVLVGLGSITRHLEELCCHSKSQSPQTTFETVDSGAILVVPPKSPEKQDQSRHLAAVFASRSSQPSIWHAHLPQLIAAVSSRYPNLPPIRLVQLPKGCEEIVCSSIGLPRASFVAVMNDAPQSKHLVDFVRANVPVIDMEWLREAQIARYLPVKINTIQTAISTPKKEKLKAKSTSSKKAKGSPG